MEWTEGKIQAEAYQWFHNSYPELRGLLYHVPNGGNRNLIEATRLKAAGVVAGIPDMVFHFKGKTWFFEFKDAKGKLSYDQVKIHDQMRSQGFIVWIVRTVEHFQELIGQIINQQPYCLAVGEPDVYGINQKTYDYRHRLFQWLYSLQIDTIHYYNNVCEIQTRPKFLEFVKEFVKLRMDKAEGFEIIIENEYLKKIVYGNAKKTN